MILENYLSSSQAILNTVLDTIRHRLNIPGLPFTDTPSPSVFNKTFKPQLMDHLPPEVEPDESLGKNLMNRIDHIVTVTIPLQVLWSRPTHLPASSVITL